MRDVVKNTKLTENCSKEVIRAFVEEVTAKLTVEEKIGIMSGQETEQKLLDDLFVLEHYNVRPYPTMAVERLGLSNVRFVDGPRGVVAGSATCFPVSMGRGDRQGDRCGSKSRGRQLFRRGMYQSSQESEMGACTGVLR